MKLINKLLLYFSGFIIMSMNGNIEAIPVTSNSAVIIDKIETIKNNIFCFADNNLYSLFIDSKNI